MAASRISLAILYLALFPVGEIDACSCSVATLEMAFDQSDAVFSGVVEALVPDAESSLLLHAFIDVLEIWKGELNAQHLVRVDTFNNTAACGYPFQVGQELVVFASTTGSPPTLWTMLCSGTGEYSRAVALDRYGPPAAYNPFNVQFRRGDVTGDGIIDISDPLNALFYQFDGTPLLPCLEAVDFQNDDQIDIVDAIASLMFQFVSGAPPADPFGECGKDRDFSPLDCASYPVCSLQQDASEIVRIETIDDQVEIEVLSERPFIPRALFPVLCVGSEAIMTSRYPDDGSENGLIFTLPQEAFDAIDDVSLVTIQHSFQCANDQLDQMPFFWDLWVFGPLETSSQIELLLSDKEREDSPEVAAGELGELVQGNTDFAVNLYHEIRQAETGNVFFSPLSISVALAMTLTGAREQTADQMRSTLHFTLPDNGLHGTFNALDFALQSRGQGLENEPGDGFQLTIANSLWGQRGFPFLDGFLDILAENYGSGMRTVDFQSATEAARLAINGWVEDQTQHRIENLLPPGVLTVDTRLVLTNAVFFKASWLSKFLEASTSDGDFHLLDGSTVSVPMMHQDTEVYAFYQGESFQAAELFYLGEELSMVILLPDPSAFESVESSLSSSMLSSVFDGLQRQRLFLTLPKFGFDFTLPLKDTLRDMGMVDAFDSNLADFSGFDGRPRFLYVQDVRHKAFIAVDENGTEAAAATAVVVGIESVPPPVVIDRPFILLIRDIPTNTVLFLGRVLDPS